MQKDGKAADEGNVGIKDYVKVRAKERVKIYRNKRLCNKKKTIGIRKKRNDQARKEDLELPIKASPCLMLIL